MSGDGEGPRPTPSQTVGPFFGFALPWPDGPRAAPAGAPGTVRIVGQLRDGAGNPVPDALVETWQATPDGEFGRPGFRGFARAPTDDDGRFEIVTQKPGGVVDRDGVRHAPHVSVSVFARGLLRRAVTRIYFDDEAAANAADPTLARIVDAAARATLLAQREAGGYRFDIRLQGDGETVFFDFHG